MDHLVHLFSGVTVNENGEFARMRQQVVRFDMVPSFDDIIGRVNSLFKVENVRMELRLRGRFDAGKGRCHYVLMPIGCENDWLFYKELVSGSQVGCAEVVVDVDTRSMDVPSQGGDEYPIEHLTQEAILPDNDSDAPEEDEYSGNDLYHDSDDDESDDEVGYDTCRVNNDFDEGSFENEEVDEDDISQSSEENEDGEGDNDMLFPGNQGTHLGQTTPQATPFVGPTPMADEMMEEVVREDRSTLFGMRIPQFTSVELRQLKAVHVDVPTVPIFHSVPREGYCDSGLRFASVEPDSGEQLIEKGMIFDSLEELKFFLSDYSVRHHRPYDVVHSSAKLRYTVQCQQGCPWKVWSRPVADDRVKWRITNVKQPHTCGTSEVSQEHSQCTARYIGRL